MYVLMSLSERLLEKKVLEVAFDPNPFFYGCRMIAISQLVNYSVSQFTAMRSVQV